MIHMICTVYENISYMSPSMLHQIVVMLFALPMTTMPRCALLICLSLRIFILDLGWCCMIQNLSNTFAAIWVLRQSSNIHILRFCENPFLLQSNVSAKITATYRACVHLLPTWVMHTYNLSSADVHSQSCNTLARRKALSLERWASWASCQSGPDHSF